MPNGVVKLQTAARTPTASQLSFAFIERKEKEPIPQPCQHRGEGVPSVTQVEALEARFARGRHRRQGIGLTQVVVRAALH